MYFLHKCMTSCSYFTKGRQECTRTFRSLSVDIRFWEAQSLPGFEIWSAFETGLNILFVCFRYRVGVYSFLIYKVTWRCFESTQMELSLIWNICMGAQHSGVSRQWSSNWNRGHWSLKETSANAREPESLENKLWPSPKSAGCGTMTSGPPAYMLILIKCAGTKFWVR